MQLLSIMLLLPVHVALALAIPTLQSPLSTISTGERPQLDPYPSLGKPRLTFHPNGTFKITVFSDLHYGENPWDDWGPEQDFNSTRLMKSVLPDEKPDFVVLNGDLITGENTFKENSTTLIDEIVAPLNALKIPFASSHGNHDNQVNITHEQEILREQKVAPLSYTRMAPRGVGGVEGPGNYWVPVYKNAHDSSPALILWFFDSRGGVSQTNTPLPDYVDSTVASWIASETKVMEKSWGTAEKRGAVAFVHIPPHFVASLQSDLSDKTPGLNADGLDASGGSVQDSSSTNKDEPFYNALVDNVPNLHAIVSGHDHGNEWCIREPTREVIFCFDKHSGYGGYGEPGWGFGVRNIVFHSPDPSVAPETWIRLEEGDTRARIVLDGKYGR